MLDLKGLIDAVSQVGLPLLIAMLVIWAVYNFASKAMKTWEDDRTELKKRDQEDWQDRRERQKLSDERDRELIRIAEQSNILIKQNTEIIERGIRIHEKTIASNEAFIEAVQTLYKDVKRNGGSGNGENTD